MQMGQYTNTRPTTNSSTDTTTDRQGPCKECRASIDIHADTCPACGFTGDQSVAGIGFGLMLIGGLITVFGAIFIIPLLLSIPLIILGSLMVIGSEPNTPLDGSVVRIDYSTGKRRTHAILLLFAFWMCGGANAFYAHHCREETKTAGFHDEETPDADTRTPEEKANDTVTHYVCGPNGWGHRGVHLVVFALTFYTVGIMNVLWALAARYEWKKRGLHIETETESSDQTTRSDTS